MSDVGSMTKEFWEWRAAQKPRLRDDIPRLVRPRGWIPDCSAAAVAAARGRLGTVTAELDALPPTADVADAVDRRLLRSAVARVRWELDVLRTWQRQPGFYVDQTIGAVFDVLLPPHPDAERLADVTRLLQATPGILDTAKSNLTGHAVAEFAHITIAELQHIRADIDAVTAALAALTPAGWTDADRDTLTDAGAAAGTALASFARWLEAELPQFQPVEPVGADAFAWFLWEVALLPFTPAEILATGLLESERAAGLELLERHRNRTTGDRVAPPPSFASWQEQAAAEADAEIAVRAFYEDNDLLTQPAHLLHYNTTLMPPYLAPIGWVGTADDLTGPDRLDSNGSAYFPPPVDNLPYFYAANAFDPRAGIIHEGAHYQQLALAWHNPRESRRHYYDSTPNEGIAFYNEELMLASGLFADAPHTREIVYNFMRLRALRVVVDVRLALGELDIEGAGAFLERAVPMDAVTAREEAAFFAASPGQAMTYQVGKTQILRLLADAAAAAGTSFSLRDFHDRLWREGNVPLALQRWELLGDAGDLERVDALAAGAAGSA